MSMPPLHDRVLRKDRRAILRALRTDIALKSYFAKPHTISCLIIILVFFMYLAIYKRVNSISTGILAAYLTFLLVSLLQFTDSVFKRPHPALWRLVKGTSIFYLMMLILILFQDKHTVRQWLKNFDGRLGVQLPDKSYGACCALTMENIYGVMDLFVPAHIFGWYFKALMIRDYYLCWILSIAFEVMEYSLAHQLANFNECWWDHWILDVLTCNAAGIHLGIKTCQYFKAKIYKWRGSEITENPLELQHWVSSATNFKRYIGLLALIVLINLAEMNTFYLKYLLWIPAEHIFNVIRLCLFVLMGCVAIREGYSYFSDRMCKSFGYQLWLCMAIILTESMVCVKFGQGEFKEPAPIEVKIFWSCVIVFVVVFGIYRYFLSKLMHKRKVE